MKEEEDIHSLGHHNITFGGSWIVFPLLSRALVVVVLLDILPCTVVHSFLL
eukprot:c13050_g1_i2 orf=102-254(+)